MLATVRLVGAMLPVELAELVVDAVMNVKSSDWARMVLRFCASATMFTWKPLPEGQPAEGGLTLMVPREVSTKAASACW